MSRKLAFVGVDMTWSRWNYGHWWRRFHLSELAAIQLKTKSFRFPRLSFNNVTLFIADSRRRVLRKNDRFAFIGNFPSWKIYVLLLSLVYNCCALRGKTNLRSLFKSKSTQSSLDKLVCLNSKFASSQCDQIRLKCTEIICRFIPLPFRENFLRFVCFSSSSSSIIIKYLFSAKLARNKPFCIKVSLLLFFNL